ncbi:MAG: hypothetical protein GY943_06525 [Chloroflexi bacterium]|nr:hypothetical protein [Chloroflexota bacterium]
MKQGAGWEKRPLSNTPSHKWGYEQGQVGGNGRILQMQNWKQNQNTTSTKTKVGC